MKTSHLDPFSDLKEPETLKKLNRILAFVPFEHKFTMVRIYKQLLSKKGKEWRHYKHWFPDVCNLTTNQLAIISHCYTGVAVPTRSQMFITIRRALKHNSRDITDHKTGYQLTLSELAEKLNIKKSTIQKRYKSGGRGLRLIRDVRSRGCGCAS